MGRETVYLGKVHWSLGLEGWPSWRFFFNTNTKWVKVFCRWQTLFFGQKCDEESVGWAGGQTLRHAYLWYLFSSNKLPKTVTVTMLLLFGPVTLLCGTFRFMELSEGPVQSSDCRTDTPSIRDVGLSIHTGSVGQYCASDTTSSGGSVLERNFIPRCLRDIDTEEEAENWHRIPASKCQCEWG